MELVLLQVWEMILYGLNIIKAMGSLLDGISSFPVKLKMIIEWLFLYKVKL
jgi:hypothetical protein